MYIIAGSTGTLGTAIVNALSNENELFLVGRDEAKLKEQASAINAEYQVIDIATGPFRYVKEGVEVEENMLSAVIIEHKENRVNVGSGFTIEQRKHFYDYPENILSKTITVQYFEEINNLFFTWNKCWKQKV